MESGATLIDFWSGILGRALSAWLTSIQRWDGILGSIALLLVVFGMSSYPQKWAARMDIEIQRVGKKVPAILVGIWFAWFVLVQIPKDFSDVATLADARIQDAQGLADDQLALKDERIDFLRDQLAERNQDIDRLMGREEGYKRDLAVADASVLEARKERDEARRVAESLRRVRWYVFPVTGPPEMPHGLEIVLAAHGTTVEPFGAELRFSAPVAHTSYQVSDDFAGGFFVALEISPEDPRQVDVRVWDPPFSPQFPLRIVVFSADTIQLREVAFVEPQPRRE